jgi:toxin ParE1/3/4
MSVDFHPEAAAEMIEAAKYYQKRSAGLGIRFLDEIDAAVDRIGDAPDRWPLLEDGYRKYSIRVFPYFVAYQITDAAITVLAVYHHSRDPEGWKNRLDE